MGEAAEHAQLALPEVALGQRGDDAATLPSDEERRHRVRDLGVEHAVADSRVVTGTEHERLEPGTEVALRCGDLEPQALEARDLLCRIPVQLAWADPTLVVDHPDGRSR